MNSLSTAIYSRGTATSSFNTSIGSRLYFVKAPQNPTYPFVIFFFVSNNVENYLATSTNSTNQITEVFCQFNIHSSTPNSSSEAGTILENLKTQFDFCDLTITGYTDLKVERTRTMGPYWLDSQEWLYSVEYKIILQKS